MILRMIESTYLIGDRLHIWLKIVPSFCLTNSIMFEASKDRLFTARPDLKDDDLSLSFIGGEMLALGVHFGFWTLILILIESGLFNFILKIPLLLPKNRIPPKNLQDIDDDVELEQSRVK